ncbi:DUF3768 domain-containing protein [Maricaulis sp.]|uniref:DUF3768 domain-containing protein n=1 Tax=Maricaulis sp. TaxID=1486257 RepID=UPI002630EE59|nr:DUF3768 domain-containing protein [Maricaulis sp.]
METTAECRTCTIRELNDALRTKGEGGRLMMTRGVYKRGDAFILAAFAAVRDFDDFTQENDPYGDHDFGRVVIKGEPLLWKIDYYDENLEFGSDDPSDPEKTTRVLTLMFADEY